MSVPITRLFGLVVVLFAVLIGFTSRWTVFEADGLEGLSRVVSVDHDGAAFHALWNRGNDDPSRRFLIEDNQALTRARLELAAAIGQIIRNGLGIMGVAAAEEMQ